MWRKTIAKVNSKLTEYSAKINAIDHKNAMHEATVSTWNDEINLAMPQNLVYNRVNVNNADHRYHQTLENPYFFKLTFQIFKRILGKRPNRPYPFMYVKNLQQKQRDSNGQKNSINQFAENGRVDRKVNSLDEANNKPLSGGRKSYASVTGNEDVQNMGDSFRGRSEEGRSEEGRSSYDRRDDLNDKLNALWDKEKLWDILIDCLSYAFGINSCAILKTKGAKTGENKYWVIPRNFFVKGYTKNRVLTKVEVRWTNWCGIEEENLGTPMQSVEKYTIGDDFVLCTPFQSFESPYGEPPLQAFWNTGVYKEILRAIQMMYYWKGGVVSNYERVPAIMSDADINAMKKEYKKGMFSELQITKVQPGASPENVDKLYTHESVVANGMYFDIGNTLLSEDSLFPKQFIEGEAESGALGGDSSDVNKQEIDDTMFYYFYSAIEKLVKDINKVFLKISDEDYTIVPFEIEDPNLDKNGDGIVDSEELQEDINIPSSENDKVGDFKKEKKANSITLTKNKKAKINSSDIKAIYEGFALVPTEYEQDDGSYEYLEADEIKRYVEDQKSVKEFYFKNEHPIDNPMEIKKNEATAKIVITGFDEKTGGAKATAYFFEEQNADELYLSPTYYSHDILRGGKTIHSDIDLRNIVSTSHARAGKNIKLTKKIGDSHNGR